MRATSFCAPATSDRSRARASSDVTSPSHGSGRGGVIAAARSSRNAASSDSMLRPSALPPSAVVVALRSSGGSGAAMTVVPEVDAALAPSAAEDGHS